MENKTYVKLRDKGTIFYDAGQKGKVSGDSVVLLEKTKRVKDAIKSGLLVEVSESDAKKMKAADNKAKQDAAAAEKEANAGTLEKLNAANEEIETLKTSHSEEIKALGEQHQTELDGLNETHAAALKAKDDEIASLKETHAAELKEQETAHKKALAEAKKK